MRSPRCRSPAVKKNRDLGSGASGHQGNRDDAWEIKNKELQMSRTTRPSWMRNPRCRSPGIGFRVQGSGFRVQGSGFRVQGSGFRVQGSGSEFRVQGGTSL